MAAHNPVGWFEIYVQDMERAKAFYEATLQTQLARLPSPELEMWQFMSEPGVPGIGGALCKMAGVPSGGSTLVYFTSDDCAVVARRAVENGGRIERDKMAIGAYGHIALVVDTEGNMIGLHSMQ